MLSLIVVSVPTDRAVFAYLFQESSHKKWTDIFLDSEIVKMERFLDPEIVKMVDRSYIEK